MDDYGKASNIDICWVKLGVGNVHMNDDKYKCNSNLGISVRRQPLPTDMEELRNLERDI